MARSGIMIVALVLLLFSTAPLVTAENTTTTTPANTTTNTTKTGNQASAGTGSWTDLFRGVFRQTTGSRYAFYIMVTAITVVVLLYIWFTPFSFGRKGGARLAAYARRVQLAPPRGYDFLVYVIDEVENTIRKDYHVKISENLYMSTSLSSPSFLYVPDHAKTYLCREGKAAVPCGLAYRQGLLSILVDPRLASAHELAAQGGLIQLDENELDKLLSTLYAKEEKKTGYIQISPETRIGIAFNIKEMIKGYLGILRSADEMMIHFLHTANQAESIERFMKTAARMQETRLSWLRWVAYFVMATAIAIAMVMIFTGG